MWQFWGKQENLLWQCGRAQRSFLGSLTCIRWLLGRQEKVIHYHCYHWIIPNSIPSQTGSKLKYFMIIILKLFFFLQKYNADCCVMTALVSDVQLIGIWWSHPILSFSQSHKLKNDWDFDLTLFWCFHNHTSLKMTEILISPVLSHGTINQKRTNS